MKKKHLNLIYFIEQLYSVKAKSNPKENITRIKVKQNKKKLISTWINL